MWTEDIIGVPVDGRFVGVWYQAKVYDLPSEYGINGGRISKLELRIGRESPVIPGEVIARYDRGWSIPPKTIVADLALDILLYIFK